MSCSIPGSDCNTLRTTHVVISQRCLSFFLLRHFLYRLLRFFYCQGIHPLSQRLYSTTRRAEHAMIKYFFFSFSLYYISREQRKRKINFENFIFGNSFATAPSRDVDQRYLRLGLLISEEMMIASAISFIGRRRFMLDLRIMSNAWSSPMPCSFMRMPLAFSTFLRVSSSS